MSKRFVRNIRDTNTGGSKLRKNQEPKEPLYTNTQNDILSDNEDIFIRNLEEYHCLTDDIKQIFTNTERIVDIVIERNKATIDVIETRIDSQDERLIVKNTAPNKFLLNLDLSVIEQNISDNASNISSIQSTLSDIQGTLSDLETRISDLEGGN